MTSFYFQHQNQLLNQNTFYHVNGVSDSVVEAQYFSHVVDFKDWLA